MFEFRFRDPLKRAVTLFGYTHSRESFPISKYLLMVNTVGAESRPQLEGEEVGH